MIRPGRAAAAWAAVSRGHGPLLFSGGFPDCRAKACTKGAFVHRNRYACLRDSESPR